MRSLLWSGVRPTVRQSVRLSVTFVHSTQTAEDIVKEPGSPIILVFLNPGADTQFQREPLQRGAKYKEVGKYCDFRLKSPSLSEIV